MDRVIADLHLHSKYARAVSGEMVPEKISQWAAKKGIGLIGTGDFTHPIWIRELGASLEEAGDGLYRLKGQPKDGPLFMLTTELSCMYGEKGRTRRVHLVVGLPSFADVSKISQKLQQRGANLISDGRPILGIPASEVVQMLLEINEKALVIPAHIWTPWFGVLGEMGGYDSLEEAFGSMAKYIPAIETGMSSDPAMNWRVAELDNRRIVSFGDAHSPAKLGREATVFRIKKSKVKSQNFNSKFKIGYEDIYGAIWGKADGDWEIESTIEFYPEEGKYHYTGHRNCKVRYSPEETKKMGSACPVCGKPLTIGVAHRVEKLAGRSGKVIVIVNSNGVREIKSGEFPERPGYVMLVPLQEILAEALGLGVASGKVQQGYERLCGEFGSEFAVLLEVGKEEIEKAAGERVADGIEKVRRGEIVVEAGYDGVFGTVKIWGQEEEVATVKQGSLF